MADARDSDAAAAAPWTQPRFVVAAVALALIAVLALVLAVSGPSDRGAAEPGPEPGPGAAAPPEDESSPVADASVCGLEDGDQDVLAVAPPGTRWELVGTMAAPTAPGAHGPGVVEGGFRSCFARSPTGALYAAAGFWALATAKPAADVLARLAAGTAVRARAIRAARAAGDEPVLDGETTLQVAGFRFVSYDPDEATVDLAVRVANGGVASLPSTLQWEDGDWKYVVPADGDPGVRQIPGLAGYAAWAGA